MTTKVEAIGNVIVILMALAVGTAMLVRQVSSFPARQMVAAGQRMGTIPGVDWNRHQRTLLLVLNTDCHFCQDSIPFYQRLAEVRGSGRDAIEFVAIFPNPTERVREFTTRQGLNIRSVPETSLETLRVNATPTLILVNREGRVEKLWVGVLSAKQELDLLNLASGA